MPTRSKTAQRYHELDERIKVLNETLIRAVEDIEWMKCTIKKLDNRIWAILVLLVSTLLSSICISILH